MTVSAGRRNDICRIEPPAETHLQQQHVRLMLGKGEEGRRGRNLELRNVVAVVDGLCARQHIDQLAFPDRPRLAVLAGQFDALMKTHQMRRRVGMHTLPSRFQHRLEVSRHRTLAVCPGYMHDGRQFGVRVAELGQQPLDAPERQVDELRVKQLQIGQELVALRHKGIPRQARRLVRESPVRIAPSTACGRTRLIFARL